jgi:hypothetical protein
LKETGPIRSGQGEGEEILRAKYLDYCSAQVADLLVYLTPDETYLLARKAAAESGSPEDVSYAQMVEVATRWISSKLALPPFEVWLEDYRAHPTLYEEYFLGLWESALRPPTEG